MSDFFQNGQIVTLHRLSERSLEELEKELIENAKKRLLALILPSLYSELEGPALPNIIKDVKNVQYLNEIIITMYRMNADQFAYSKEFFSELPQHWRIIWNDGPRMKKLYRHLEKIGIDISDQGKGSQTWMAFGYILATGVSDVIALHDCDIRNYSRELLARLVYPMMHPTHPFEFCKGYYSRLSDRLHGRVTRLFATPLIRSLQKMIGPNDFLDYLDSFRYILAGEFALSVELAQQMRIPADWGLEMGVLSEVHRNTVLHRVAQVDIAKVYEHKHQELVWNDLSAGLLKMATDIAKSLFRTLAAQGIIFTPEFFMTLKSTYLRTARDFISRYAMDASLNGLKYDRHIEARTAETFVQSIIRAGQVLLETPYETTFIPSWNRVIDAEPRFFEMLIEAVEEDNLR
ncbi:MAG: glycosyl transferase [Calditrichaeota bacterium]|nr:glycosyl transferase [Calditrichota bacterium]RQW03949.1 MAG: glycosyl transferase [Calditrichota bacterium]